MFLVLQEVYFFWIYMDHIFLEVPLGNIAFTNYKSISDTLQKFSLSNQDQDFIEPLIPDLELPLCIAYSPKIKIRRSPIHQKFKNKAMSQPCKSPNRDRLFIKNKNNAITLILGLIRFQS